MNPSKRQKLDLLHGTLWDKVLMVALPLAATGILQQLFNAADVAVVGQFVGKEAMAAVGSNSATINLLINLFVGISLGTNVIISQSIGQGDRDSIHKAVHTSITVALIGGLALAVGGQFLVGPVLQFLDVPDDVFPMAGLYLRIYLTGMPVILLYNFESAIFRAQGDTRTPLLVLSASGITNVALNLFFVIGLKRTVDGVAIATVVSNVLSSLILFFLLTRSESDVRIDLHYMVFDLPILLRIAKIGIPAGIQSMVFSLANICIQSAINSLGTVVMAASSAAYNLEVFTYTIINSIGQACTTIVGQNCGAGQLERCHRAMRITLLTATGFFAVTAVFLLSIAAPLLGLFNPDPEVIATGLIRVKFMFFAHTFSLIIEVMSGYLRGFGMSLLPALCSLFFVCGIRFYWVWSVFPRFSNFTTLMMVYPVSLCATALVIVGVYLCTRHAIDSRTTLRLQHAGA